MDFNSETTENGVFQQHFTIGDVTGVLWTPAGATGARPLVLLGHGGGQHKLAPGIVARAGRFVSAGFAAAAIDAPGHGDRPKTEQDLQFSAEIRRRMTAGEPVGELVTRDNAARAIQAIPEWQETLDALQKLDTVGPDGPVGYFGISMGATIGIPLVAAEPRITAAVLGLAGAEALAGAAAQITVPVEFVLQWDDELISRESGLALFDAFGSSEKSLHANQGKHHEVPRFEVDSAERFFRRHLSTH